MLETLDPPGLDQDTLWLQDFITSKPDAISNAIETPTPHATRIARLIKHRADVEPPRGYPTFDTHGPAPSIAHHQPYEDFFGAPFTVWINSSHD